MSHMPRAAILVSSAAALLLVGSGPLHQLGMLSYEAGLNGLRAAVAFGVAAIAIALPASVAAIRRRSTAHLLIGIACVLTGTLAIAAPVRARAAARAAAPLHDVTTDVADPPAFVALLSEYEARPGVLARDAGADALQRRAYPDLGPLVLPVSPEMAFEEVLESMTELDWPVEDANPDQGRVETTVRSPWFGFTDDLVIRLRAVGPSTRVDVRSVTRDGSNDMGRNAAHVREFLAELRR